MVSSCWLPADLAVLIEADPEVVTAAVLLVSPEFEQAGNVPLAVGRGSSSLTFPPSVEEQSADVAGVGQADLDVRTAVWVVQDGLDLEVSVDAMLVWAEHR